MRKIIESIKNWYKGKYISPEERSGSEIKFVLGMYEKHWTAKLVCAIIAFCLKEWKWLLPFIVSLIAILIAIKKL